MVVKQIIITALLVCAFPIVQATTYLPANQTSAALAIPTASSNDTVFIFREVTDSYYHVIYVEKNRESKIYKAAIDFSINEWHNQLYHRYKSRIEQEAPGSFTEHETYDLPQNWLPLYKYKNKYYLYDPSDGRCSRTMIKSREYITWGVEGPSPFPLKSVEKRSDAEYIVSLLNPFEHRPSIATRITIHIIDPETKMAVFEYANQDGVRGYKLCIPAVNAFNFDLIVNHCEETRQTEFEFDTIDYAQLLGTPNTR